MTDMGRPVVCCLIPLFGVIQLQYVPIKIAKKLLKCVHDYCTHVVDVTEKNGCPARGLHFVLSFKNDYPATSQTCIQQRRFPNQQKSMLAPHLHPKPVNEFRSGSALLCELEFGGRNKQCCILTRDVLDSLDPCVVDLENIEKGRQQRGWSAGAAQEGHSRQNEFAAHPGDVRCESREFENGRSSAVIEMAFDGSVDLRMGNCV